MLFYHKGLRGRKAPLPFVACARKTVILRGQIWSAHESDVVGIIRVSINSPAVRREKTFGDEDSDVHKSTQPIAAPG